VFIQSVYESSLPQQHTYDSAYILSTQALSGIKVYAPDDLVITVGAGTSLREIQTFLAQHRLQLALASPWPDATIGGLVATNTNAPLRMRYGALRDQVLCMTVALPDGRVIRTGRPIVKNVAGYDLTKAFIGSYGTLGLICDIALKISAQPREQRTILIPVETLEQGIQFGQQLMRVALTASAIVLGKAAALPEWSGSNYVLVYTAEGTSEDVWAELAQVRDLLTTLQALSTFETDQTTGSQLWSNILGAKSKNHIVVRTGVPIKSLYAYVLECASLIDAEDWIVDIANGFVYTMHASQSAAETLSWLNALRAPALKREGYAIVMDMPALPEIINSGLDRWGYQPQSLHIMQRLKARWDAAGILNPGMFLVR
jgi:D-lactate dehydrogenase (cytochrome)